MKDEAQRAKGNLRQDRFVRKTEKASLVEEFEREKAQLVDAAKHALAENDRLRDEAKSAHDSLRDAVGRLQSFQASPPNSGEKEQQQRRINYKNPGRRTIGKDVDDLTEWFRARYGDNWLEKLDSAAENYADDELLQKGKASYPAKVLGAFISRHKTRLDLRTVLPRSVLKRVEKEVADCIADHFDEMSLDLFVQGNMSWRDYQTTVNLLCSKRGAEGLIRAVLPEGTKFPKLKSTGVLRKRLEALKKDLGVDTSVLHAAMGDAKIILENRIRSLIAKGYDFTLPGSTDNVVLIQLLGDSCGIFKKNKVQGTSMVLKTIYSKLNPDDKPAVEEILNECGVNSVENCTLLAFYLGDDKYTDIHAKLPQLSAMVAQLLSQEGMEVDGVKYTFKVTFGGDYLRLCAALY